MEEKLLSGQRVTVNAFGGKQLSRIVVEDIGQTVLICKLEEFDRAKAEGRPPVYIGFPKSDVTKDHEQRGHESHA